MSLQGLLGPASGRIDLVSIAPSAFVSIVSRQGCGGVCGDESGWRATGAIVG